MKLLKIFITTVLVTAILVGSGLWITKKVGAVDLLTWDEYQELISMYNYEVEKAGGQLVLDNVSGENGFINALHAKIRSRAVEASDGRVRGKVLTSNEYANKREILMQKAEAQL